ncbi:HAD-IA family hydrolase [Paenibacillus sp. LMG 31456]|uniref:HAD-IA family hydrolase n=1 Tax=Paenibacillus foliorum TaxID=2654974 RepID=A0A972GS48_9BACL|nr:HAD-IA family hydrolase [Paenibacillus foliorum]NOU92837.1 HAD-IA family hydrolase [Paenibacillus foliorum]
MILRKPLNLYKAVFFDVGDTLMTIPAARVIMQQFLAARSLHRAEEEVGDLFTEAFRLFYYGRQLDPFEVCTPESDRAFWMKLYHYILDKLGVQEENWTDERIHQCCHGLYDLFTGPEAYQLFDDVSECIPNLQARGLQLGIISNFAPTLPDILQKKGIAHYFDPIIVSTLVGLEKPDPAIFKLALEQSGLLAEDVLYIGDHDRNDIWAPNQVGIDAVKIKRYDYHSGEGIHTLHELLQA